MNKEQKKPQEDSWEEEFEWFYDCDAIFRSVTALDSVKNHIRSNFIAKRDLRKLLEEYRNGYKDSYGVTEEGKRYYRGLEWAEGYNSALDDILAEIEKL